MRKEKISEIIGNINLKYIEEAAIYEGRKRRPRGNVWLKWSAAVASVAFIVFLWGVIFGRTYMVTLDNGDTIKFVKDKSAATDTEGKIEGISRSLTEEEIQQLFGNLPVKAYGLFDIENHQLFLLCGRIGDVELYVTTSDSLFGNTENRGYADASIIDGITVHGGYFYNRGENPEVVYKASFDIGNSAVCLKCTEEYENAESARNQTAEAVYALIKNGAINLEQIVK